MSLLDRLILWKPLLTQSGLFFDIFYQLGWAAAMLLKFLADGAEDLLDTSYRLFDFTSSLGLSSFFDNTTTRTILALLMAASILVLGWLYLFDSGKERPPVVKNLMIFILVVCAFPTALTALNSATVQMKDVIKGDTVHLSDRVLAGSITDLKHIAIQGLDNYTVDNGMVRGSGGFQKNGFQGKEQDAEFIDIKEKMDEAAAKDVHDATGNIGEELNIFGNRLTTDDDGNFVEKPIPMNKIFSWDLTEWYYRYNIDFLSVYIALIALILAFFFAAWKMARLCFEVALNGAVLPFFAAAGVHSQKRTVELIKNIISSYAVALIMLMFLKVYVLGSVWLMEQDFDPLTRSFFLIAWAATVIDAPNIIEKILGIDAGLKSGFKALAGGFMVTRTAGKAIGAAVGTAKGAVSGVRGMRLRREERAYRGASLEKMSGISAGSNTGAASETGAAPAALPKASADGNAAAKKDVTGKAKPEQLQPNDKPPANDESFDGKRGQNSSGTAPQTSSPGRAGQIRPSGSQPRPAGDYRAGAAPILRPTSSHTPANENLTGTVPSEFDKPPISRKPKQGENTNAK
jgi:hypothetical protein